MKLPSLVEQTSCAFSNVPQAYYTWLHKWLLACGVVVNANSKPLETYPQMLYEEATCKNDDEAIERLRTTGEGKEVMTRFKVCKEEKTQIMQWKQ